MSSTAATDRTNAGVDTKAQRIKQRNLLKKNRTDRRAEIKRGIEQAKDDEDAKRKYQEELDEMDIDENNDDPDEAMGKVKSEPTDETASLHTIPKEPNEAGEASAGAGNAASSANPGQRAEGNDVVQSIEGGGPGGSMEDPLPVDEDGDPVRGSSVDRGEQDSLAGLPVETVAVRRKAVGKTRIDRDYINMYGPRSVARFTIDEKLHLKDGQSTTDLLDVSNPIERTIDRQTRNPGERRTATDVKDLIYVAWVYEPGISKWERLNMLNPRSVKKSDEYPTRKARQEAKRQGLRLVDYPTAYVYVRWKSGQPKSWETASAVRLLYPRDPIAVEERIYNTACQQEDRHEQWLEKVRPGRDTSPTPGPAWTLRNETPAPRAAQAFQPQTARAESQSTAVAPRIPAPATAPNLEAGLQAFIDSYKEKKKITTFSEAQKMDALLDWRFVKKALEENVVF